MDEVYYSVFLPRCERTFTWLDRHCMDRWNSDDDYFDHFVIYVSFDEKEDAEMAVKCLYEHGSVLIH